MSAAPQFPPNYDDRDRNVQSPPAPPRRPIWQRVIFWVVIGILILLALIAAAIYAGLHTRAFQGYILGIAQKRVSAALGTNVTYQRYNVNFSGVNPTIDLYGVVVQGSPPHPTPALLKVQHLRVGVNLSSAFGSGWYLTQLVVDKPVVHVFVDKNGQDNLPKSQTSSSSSSNTNFFSLGIRHAVIDHGQIFYNNNKSALEADLQNLALQSKFNPSNQSYTGTLAYDDGHLKMADYNTIQHSFRAAFLATPKEFVLKNAVLRSGPSDFVLNATMTNYSHPHIVANYNATIDAGQFRKILKNSTLPNGVIALSGKMNYVAKPNEPALQAVDINGTIRSNELIVKSAKFSGPIHNLSSNYTVQNGNLAMPDIRAQLLGGQLDGTLTMQNITGAQQSKLDATLNNVNISRLRTIVKSPALAKLRGHAQAHITATWGKSFSNLNVNADVNLNSKITPRKMSRLQAPAVGVKWTNAAYHGDAQVHYATLAYRPGAVRLIETALPQNTSNNSGNQNNNGNNNAASQNSIPVTGHIHLHYSGKSKQLKVTNSYIKTPNTTLTFNGALNSRAGMAINLNHVDLHQLETLVSVFSSSSKPLIPPDISGIASFHGRVRGTTSAPRLMGSLVITNLAVHGTRWRLLQTNVDVSPSRVNLANGLLQSTAAGRATFAVDLGLHHWSFQKTSPFRASVNAQQLDLANISKAAGVSTPMTGSLNATVNAHGTEETALGNAQIRVTRAELAGQPVKLIQLKATSDGNAVRANLGMNLPAGSATANATYYLKQQNYNAIFKAVGIQLGQLAAVKSKNLGITGVLTLNASGSGNIHNPQFAATMQVPKLQVKGQAISGLQLRAHVANHVANVALGSQVLNTSVAGKARIDLAGSYETVASLDTQAIPLAPLIAAYSPAEAGDITGQTELHANIQGPLKNIRQIQAHAVVPVLTVNYQNAVHIAAPQPIHIDYVNGVLNIQRTALQGTDTDLQFQGRVPVIDKAQPASLLLLGTVNLKLMQVFDPTVTSSGQLRFNINSFGQLANPNVEGQVRVINAAFSTASAPLGLSNGNGVLTLTRDRLEITKFTGKVGGGTVTASGAMIYRPNLRFDMALQGRRIHLLFPQGVRSDLGAKLTLTGSTENATLGGKVNLYRVSLTPGFDMTSLMTSMGGATTPPPSTGFVSNLQLNVGLHTINGINLVNRQLSVNGAMNLNVKGTAAQPVVLGRVNLTGGDFLFNNERFILQGGTIDFANPSYTQPVLNVSLSTTVQQYDVTMRFTGPADHMRTNYTSVPSLPEADIIHLIAFGSTTEAAGASTVPGNLAAEQKIASAVSGQITSRVAKIAGLSQLSIDPTLGAPGGQANPGAVITVQQRVTGKIFVTFSTDVTNSRNEVIQLQYKQSPKLSFSGTRDQNGGFAFDTSIHKSW